MCIVSVCVCVCVCVSVCECTCARACTSFVLNGYVLMCLFASSLRVCLCT